MKILKGENEKLRDKIKILESKKVVPPPSSDQVMEEDKNESISLTEQLKVGYRVKEFTKY